jgi:plasmid stabilization system protein ParE
VTQAWLRPRAEADLVERTGHYLSVGGPDLGNRFFDAALAALHSVEGMPSIGSPQVGEMCDIPGLRAVPVEGFPLHWYYFIADDHLDVVRLLADARDLAATLEPEG